MLNRIVAVMCLRVGTPQPVRGWGSLSVAFLQLQRVVRWAIFCAGPLYLLTEHARADTNSANTRLVRVRLDSFMNAVQLWPLSSETSSAIMAFR